MKKMKMHSPSLTQDNVARVRDLFPTCVVEVMGEDGQVKLVVDFDQLRQELSEAIVEGPQERYQLNWPGKRGSVLLANSPIARTLRPDLEASVNFGLTKNLFIAGDNLEALKLLQESYLGKVKLIYIDPPYNTGEDFLYEDNFAESSEDYLVKSSQCSETGAKLVANTEANGRFHSDWLTMMSARLRLSRNLLADNGVIFISIDDSEHSNLKSICSEIYGEKNYLGTILWKKKTNGNNMGYIPPVHDYILCYGKSAAEDSIFGFPLTEEYINSTYKNPDNDPRGTWTTMDLSANHEGPLFEIVNPNTGKGYWPAEGRYWVFNEAEVQRRIKEGRIIFGKTGNAGPIQKKYLSDRESNRTKPESWWDKHGMNSDGTTELAKLFAPKAFDHPKPTTLLKNIINIATKDDDIVLDFFAGSGSFAHAVMLQNNEDGGARRYICIQLPEECDKNSIAFKKCGIQNIAELAKERIRRVGVELVTKNSKVDVGFRAFVIDTSNMADVYYSPDVIEKGNLDLFVDNIKPDRTPEDLLFQVMLDWGVDLALPISKQTIKDREVFFVDSNVLAACFDASGGIDETFVKELAKLEPLRVVFRDAGFKNSAVKINVEQIFKLLSPATEVKHI